MRSPDVKTGVPSIISGTPETSYNDISGYITKIDIFSEFTLTLVQILIEEY